MTQKMLLFADDSSYRRLIEEGDFPTLWKNADRLDQVLDERDCPGCLRISPHWFDNTPETIRSRQYTEWETIFAAIDDRLICYLVVLNRDETASDSPQRGEPEPAGNSATPPATIQLRQHLEFYRQFRKRLLDAVKSREAHARHVLILVCQHQLTQAEQAMIQQATERENGRLFETVFLMADKLEPTEEQALLHSQVVWPAAVSNLLAVLLHKDAAEPGIYVWRTAQVRIDGLSRALEPIERRITQQFHEKVWHDDAVGARRVERQGASLTVDIPKVASREDLCALWRQLSRTAVQPPGFNFASVLQQPSDVIAWMQKRMAPTDLSELHNVTDRILNDFLNVENQYRLFSPSRFNVAGNNWGKNALAAFIVILLGLLLVGLVNGFPETQAPTVQRTILQHGLIWGGGLLLVVLACCWAWVHFTGRDRRRDATERFRASEQQRKSLRLRVAAAAWTFQRRLRQLASERYMSEVAKEIYHVVSAHLSTADAPEADTTREAEPSVLNVTARPALSKSAQWELAQYLKTSRMNYSETEQSVAGCIDRQGHDIEQFLERQANRFKEDIWGRFWQEHNLLRKGKYCLNKLGQSVKQFRCEFGNTLHNLLVGMVLRRANENFNIWQRLYTYLRTSNYLGTLSCQVDSWRSKFLRQSTSPICQLYVSDLLSPQAIPTDLKGITGDPKQLSELVPSPPILALVFERIELCLHFVGSRT